MSRTRTTKRHLVYGIYESIVLNSEKFVDAILKIIELIAVHSFPTTTLARRRSLIYHTEYLPPNSTSQHQQESPIVLQPPTKGIAAFLMKVHFNIRPDRSK